MGIKNLKKFIKSKAPSGIIIDNPYELFKNTKIAIDISVYLYKFVYNTDNKSKNYYLKGINEMIYDFLSNNIIPIFIFDGKPNDAKNFTLEKRKKSNENKKDIINSSLIIIAKYLDLSEDKLDKITNDEINMKLYMFLENNKISDDDKNILEKALQDYNKNYKNIVKISNEIIENTEKLLNLWGIPYFKASSEADFLCAKLSKDGIVSAVCSEDMDLLVHGVGNLITGICNFDFKKTGKTTIFVLENILKELEISMDQFIDICILSGCDYCNTIKDIGAIKGLPLIKKYLTIEKIPQYKDGIINGIDIARNEFKNYNNETYNIDNIDKRETDKEKLIVFLMNNTTYKRSTIEKKCLVLF